MTNENKYMMWIISLLGIFILLSIVVMSGKTAGFDEAILLVMRNADDLSIAIGPQWLTETARDITALGSIIWLFGVSFMFALISFLGNHKRIAYFIMTSTLGSWLISFSLKYLFSRARPDLISREAEVYSQSFPSAHALMTVSIYSALCLVISRYLINASQKVVLWASFIFLISAVGVSRLYLGVHWATDVFAGWILGSLFIIILCRWLNPIQHDSLQVFKQKQYEYQNKSEA